MFIFKLGEILVLKKVSGGMYVCIRIALKYVNITNKVYNTTVAFCNFTRLIQYPLTETINNY